MAEGSDEGHKHPVSPAVTDRFTYFTVLQKGTSLHYTVPSFPVFTVMLREVKLQFENDEGDVQVFDGFMRECGLLDEPLPAIARVPDGYRNAFLIEDEEFSRCIDVSAYKLYQGSHVFVIWRWNWREHSDASDSDIEDFPQMALPSIDPSTTSDSSDCDADAIPAITHSVVFKCIGAQKEIHYQEILALVAKKIKQGVTVPVRVQKEPSNPVDSRAIAFECKVNDQWERIGYVVHEALDAVHEAIDHQKIIQVRFEWVKYIVYFSNRGWYAGILISKQGDWPQSVMQCRAKTFV